LLVVFTGSSVPKPAPGTDAVIEAAGGAPRLEELERELSMTKEYLQSTIEERETANEELQSANEELQSTNEELQSTNEEIETSKEELQSTNEELTTINDELHNRMRELSQSNDDLHNLLMGIESAMVIVGMDLRIRRYTVAAEKLLNLVPSDIGRSISHVKSFLSAPELERVIGGVIENVAPEDREVRGFDERWYQMRIAPYKTTEHVIRGAVLTFLDIDALRRLDDITRWLEPLAEPIVILDEQKRLLWASDGFRAWAGGPAGAESGTSLALLAGGRLAGAQLDREVERALADGSAFRGVQPGSAEPAGGGVRVSGGRVVAHGRRPRMVLLAIAPAAPSWEPGGA
jgi:two-component system CheB/CheR fusion protein